MAFDWPKKQTAITSLSWPTKTPLTRILPELAEELLGGTVQFLLVLIFFETKAYLGMI